MHKRILVLTLFTLVISLYPWEKAVWASERAYTFGVVPQFEANELASIWLPILKELEGRTGLKFKLTGSPRIPDFETNFSKGEFGIIAFNDVGRVWLEGEESSLWHHGYGGGIWVSPFSMAVLTACYELSKDEPDGLFTLRFKFLF